MATTSGQSNFFLSCAEVVQEALDQCEIRPPEITGEIMISARRSLNLEIISWGSDVPLLWKIDATPTLIPLQQGVSVYNLPTDTVTMLDTYIRTFQLPNQFNITPYFTTSAGSDIITAVVANSGLLPGYWFQITTPVWVDGLLLEGFYEVVTVLNTNTFTFIAAGNATNGVTGGGTLALFTTTPTSPLVRVTLNNHGYAAGQSFNVAATTTVGGISLYGTYNITSVIDQNNFVIQTYTPAPLGAVSYENNGLLQVQGQSFSVDPIDRILTPIGRTDYAMFPDKFNQTIPTQYLFLRNVNPTVTLYQVPDGNGPYLLSTYLMRRIQNADVTMGEIPDIHYLFLDVLCSKLAVRLAVKYAKKMLPILKPLADEAWNKVIKENREQGVENYVTPNLSGYWNIGG